jgi:hypothetical protein
MLLRQPNKYKAEEILPLVAPHAHNQVIDGDRVKLNSTGLLCFKEYGTKCASCGMEGIKKVFRKPLMVLKVILSHIKSEYRPPIKSSYVFWL